jgi:hypothetical protein
MNTLIIVAAVLALYGLYRFVKWVRQIGVL